MTSDKILIRHITLERAGTFVPGVREVGVTGQEAEDVDVTGVNSTQRETRTAIPAPGRIEGTLFYDPNNPVHKLLEGDLESGNPQTFSLRLKGTVEDGKYTGDARTVATESVTITAASGNNKARISSSAVAEKVVPGDYVLHGTRTLAIVDSINGASIFLNPEGSTPVAAIGTETELTFKRPAIKFEYQGRVSSFSVDSGEHSAPLTASFAITVDGSPTKNYGTPDL